MNRQAYADLMDRLRSLGTRASGVVVKDLILKALVKDPGPNPIRIDIKEVRRIADGAGTRESVSVGQIMNAIGSYLEG